MSVEMKAGIGYSSRAIFLSEALDPAINEAPVSSTLLDQNAVSPWAPWGQDNNLPKTLADHIENCGVLSAAIDAKARISVGKGLQPFILENIANDGTEELKWLNDAEILDFLEDNNLFEKMLDFSFDKNGYGWRAGSFILNPKRDKIARITRKDIYEVRLEKKAKSGFIENIYLSGNWGQFSTGFDKKNHIKIPALKEDFELWDLQNRKSGFEFAFIDRRRRNGRQYYPLALWTAAKEWVKVARAVPGHKNTQFERQISLQYVVKISNLYWKNQYAGWDSMEPEKRLEKANEKYNEIDQWLSGSANAYKSIFCGSYIDPVSGKEIDDIKIESLGDKTIDGKMLPDSAAANSEILFALSVNPSLTGAGSPGSGPYAGSAGGSNVRESYLVQMMMLEEERKMNSTHLNLVKKFNGWDQKYKDKKIVFRYQSGLLTTLDTGKSTKNENL